MFGRGFSGTVYDGESISCQVDGFDAVATIHRDDVQDSPWEREDGHGPVSDWRRRNYAGRYDKRGGELLLSDDGGSLYNGSARFYDFAEACRIARRDGWGFAPAPMVTKRNSGGRWAAWFGSDDGTKVERFRVSKIDHTGVVAGFEDINSAVRALYDAHRATMGERAYAAAAARADFERLRAWCNDEWQYVGVSVTVKRAGVTLVQPYSVALWGIESDAPEYLAETANELLSEALDEARDAIGRLVDA